MHFSIYSICCQRHFLTQTLAAVLADIGAAESEKPWLYRTCISCHKHMKHLKYGIKYVTTFPGTERTTVWESSFLKSF